MHRRKTGHRKAKRRENMKRLLLTLALCMSLFAGGFLLTIQNGVEIVVNTGVEFHL